MPQIIEGTYAKNKAAIGWIWKTAQIAPDHSKLKTENLQGPWTAVQGLELKLILRKSPSASLQGILQDFAINIGAIWKLKHTQELQALIGILLTQAIH